MGDVTLADREYPAVPTRGSIAIEWDCPLRDRLFLQYRQGVRDWVGAINQLEKKSHEPQLMSRIEEARSRALTSKAAYCKHMAGHDCGSAIVPMTFTAESAARPGLEDSCRLSVAKKRRLSR